MNHIELNRAAEAIEKADAIMIGAGAGMGVESGLPNFRGPQGFWRAYPPYESLNLDFHSIANPALFARNPALAWGFYGHRLAMYRTTAPHQGFEILRGWSGKKPFGSFVHSSNVDGQFQKAGFPAERINEIHGSIHYLQCTQNCGIDIFPAGDLHIEVNENTMTALEPFPACPNCYALARPNILMFGDGDWDSARSDGQDELFDNWIRELKEANAKLVVIELGAGTAIPSVQNQSERISKAFKCPLIRINPDESWVPAGQISLKEGAKAALAALHEINSQ